MSYPLLSPRASPLDLTVLSSLAQDVLLLERLPVGHGDLKLVETLVASEHARERVRRVNDFFLRAEVPDSVQILKVAAKLALRHEDAGVRLLFAFLEVRPPGVEVLRRLEVLQSLERVGLRLVAGTWKGSEESGEITPVYPLLDVLEVGTRIGALDLGLDMLPRRPEAVNSLFSHLRRWMRERVDTLEDGHRIPDEAIHFITQLTMLEIDLLEKRVSRLASVIDPYDGRAIARLMPVMSRYDQDIEHMKGVVARLTTYEPFFDRMLTLEHTITSKEMSRLEKGLRQDPLGVGVARVTAAMRARPVLDTHFAYLVALVSHLAAWRSDLRENAPRADLLSIMTLVLEKMEAEDGLLVAMERDVADLLWPRVQSWGALRPEPDRLDIRVRRERLADFLRPDGTPQLSELPPDAERPPFTVKEMVRLQMTNEPFLLGLLENPKVVAVPGIVSLIAEQTRSLKVLDKILRCHELHTGANKDVPRLLLGNPSRIPVNRIRSFVHVRFVSKTDLQRLLRPGTGIRPEVRKEITEYLNELKH